MISRRVLLVDDGTIFPGLESKLRERGYDVLRAFSADEAAEMAERETPDVVIRRSPPDGGAPDLGGSGVMIRTSEPVLEGGCQQWHQGLDDRDLGVTLDYIFALIGLRREKRAVEKELAEAQGKLSRMEERCRCDAAILSESESHRHTVLDATPDPIVLYDTARRVRYVNSAFTHVFGWKPDDLIGKGMAAFVPPEKAGEEEEMARKERNGQSYASVETWRYTCAGKMIPVSISGAAYRDRGGTVLGSVCNIRDISRQKELESQLVQSQKMEAIGTLAGGIVHDFNNILSAVFGYLDLALMELPEKTAAAESLNRVMEAAQRARELVRQILSFSRRQEPGWKAVNLKSVFDEALALIRASLPSSIEIRYQCGEGDLWVLADSTQMHQVVMNLCTNAHHAMGTIGGILSVTLSRVALQSSDACWDLAPGGYVKISVSDTGCGMDRNEVKRIFDPYYTTKSKDMGTGLGLAVVQRIIKDHHGMVRVSSEPGRGTCFELLLPEGRGPLAFAAERKPDGYGQRAHPFCG